MELDTPQVITTPHLQYYSYSHPPLKLSTCWEAGTQNEPSKDHPRGPGDLLGSRSCWGGKAGTCGGKKDIHPNMPRSCSSVLIGFTTGSIIRTSLREKVNPKDWQVASPLVIIGLSPIFSGLFQVIMANPEELQQNWNHSPTLFKLI